MSKNRNLVYLALYKGNGKKLLHKIEDAAIRLFTWGKYSHCEIAVENAGRYTCYSASPREGGVRRKVIDLNNGKWDLIPLHNLTEAHVLSYYQKTAGKPYDFWGAFGIVLPVKQREGKFFCSEWCYNAIFGGNEGHKFSPNALAKLVGRTQP